MVDRDKINQVFFNLYKNAAQAPVGKATPTARAYRSGEAVFIEIADTGTGVPDDVNLFDFRRSSGKAWDLVSWSGNRL